MTLPFEEFSKELAQLVYAYQQQGLSYAEAVGSLRLVAAALEAKASGGYVAHLTVVEVEDVNPEDNQEWWQK